MTTTLTEDDPAFTLVPGLSAEAIDERLRRSCRVADLGNRATAFYLADLHERGLHQALGFPTAVAYAVRALGMSRRQARPCTSSSTPRAGRCGRTRGRSCARSAATTSSCATPTSSAR